MNRARLGATLGALAILALAVAASAIVTTTWPHASPAYSLGAAVALASTALLVPRFRKLALVEFLFENDVFFGTGVVAALVWANVDLASYHATTHDLHFVVTDVLMALFFGVATKEVTESVLPGGPLASPSRAVLPLVATAGGMLGPAALYAGGALVLGTPELLRGWAIPTATDIAFSAIVARYAFGAGHPAIPFLLLLAIADDAGGLAIIALAYPKGAVRPAWLLLVAAGIVAGLLLRRRGAKSPWPYLLIGGGASWLGLHEAGLHPALALVPIVPTMPPGARDAGLFVADTTPHEHSTLERFEELVAAPVALVLGLFGLVSAGVPLASVGPPTALVLVGLLVGKPMGIGLAVAIGTRCGLVLPEGIGRREVLALGVTAGIGFTVSLFVATVAFDASQGPVLAAAKMGALLSVAAAPAGYALARLMRIPRRP